ncbi:MAG: CD225/dispanin family protein [Verrucomicrobiota bacterium]
MEWYYASNGQQNGPISQEELISLFKNGQVQASDLVWNETMADWVPFSSVSDLNPPAVSTDPGGSEEAPPPMDPAPAPVTTPAPAAVTSAQTSATGEKIPTYLWQSIVLLIVCCLPAAVVALVYSVKVEPALEAGDISGAKEASDAAKMWCWISFGLGLIFHLFIIGSLIIGATAQY